MRRINNVSRLSTNVGVVEHLRVLKEADSSQRGPEAGCRRYIYTLHLSYMHYIREFKGEGGGAICGISPPPLEFGPKRGHFSLSFSSQEPRVLKGRRCRARWMRFKLGVKRRGERRRGRSNNDKRRRSAVASPWRRRLCDLSLLPLAVKMAERSVYAILAPQSFFFFTHMQFCAFAACC